MCILYCKMYAFFVCANVLSSSSGVFFAVWLYNKHCARVKKRDLFWKWNRSGMIVIDKQAHAFTLGTVKISYSHIPWNTHRIPESWPGHEIKPTWISLISYIILRFQCYLAIVGRMLSISSDFSTEVNEEITSAIQFKFKSIALLCHLIKTHI